MGKCIWLHISKMKLPMTVVQKVKDLAGSRYWLRQRTTFRLQCLKTKLEATDQR